jgi:hypothetical protein
MLSPRSALCVVASTGTPTDGWRAREGTWDQCSRSVHHLSRVMPALDNVTGPYLQELLNRTYRSRSLSGRDLTTAIGVTFGRYPAIVA